MSKSIYESFTIDWNRAVHINDKIDDTLVKRLTPEILRLRSESDLPITVGIDSPGGSLASLDVLIGLLRGPNQRAKGGKIITVVTNRAYSAAANLLAFGDYAVAMRHAKILYHDVRYSGMQDVTPDKASAAAKDLRDTNERFALKLASSIVSRMMWNYINLAPKFEESKERLPTVLAHFQEKLGPAVQPTQSCALDVVSFMLALYRKLSTQSDQLILDVAERLSRWVHMTQIVADAPTFRVSGRKTAGVLDGAQALYDSLRKKARLPKNGDIPFADDLKMLLCLTVKTLADQKRMTSRDFTTAFGDVMHEFSVIQAMNAPTHAKETIRLMLFHQETCFGKEIINDEFFAKSDEEQEAILAPVRPIAQMFWYFCALLCRELFAGDHLLTPYDAQLLGLVDEVSGGGGIQSQRESLIATDEAQQAEDAKKELSAKAGRKGKRSPADTSHTK
jgi:ATP-dependent protease ClpP protease subunit